mmetsp:Transcript_237/g.230  ORF Transcript_237/g.230 Transcript_237/m.230 type:complete len:120 (+) Transcript_237:311-670(+)
MSQIDETDDITLDQQLVDFINQLIMNKKITVIKKPNQDLDEESEYFTCKDRGSLAAFSLNEHEYEIYMVNPIGYEETEEERKIQRTMSECSIDDFKEQFQMEEEEIVEEEKIVEEEEIE